MKPSALFSLSLFLTAVFSASGAGLARSCPSCPETISSNTAASTTIVKDSFDATFKSDVLESTRPVLVDFYATWCGPCKMMAPVIEKLSDEYASKIAVFRVDIDKNPKLATAYKIRSIPTLKLFKNGKIVEESLGVISISELRRKLDKAL